MKIEEFGQWLAVGMFLALLIAIYFTNRNTSKEQIIKYLTRRGASNIQIEHSLFDGDRDTLTFYIRYTGIQGNPHSTTCKARSGIFDAGGLFWSDLPELNPLPGEEAAPAAPQNDLDPFGEKIRARSTIALPTYRVVKTLPILGTEDKIVLLDAGHSFQNLLRCHADGQIVWQAELPSAEDAYTDVEWRDGDLIAVNKSSIMVTLNLKTGKIVEEPN